MHEYFARTYLLKSLRVTESCCCKPQLACTSCRCSPAGFLLTADPSGRYGIPQTAGMDDRFQCDSDNPTIRASTGFPMCIPRTDPAAGDDPLCPVSYVAGCAPALYVASIDSQASTAGTPPRINEVDCVQKRKLSDSATWLCPNRAGRV
jgi:hypothetical protein